MMELTERLSACVERSVCLDFKDSSDSKSRSRLQDSISQGLLMLVKEPVDSSILLNFTFSKLEYCSVKKPPSRSILLGVRDLCVFNEASAPSAKSGKNIFYWQHAKYSPGCCSKQTYTRTRQKEGRRKEMRKRKREMCLIQHQKYTPIFKHLKGTLIC